MPDLPELDEILEKLVEDTLGIKYWDAAEGILHPAFAEAEAKLNKLLIEARIEGMEQAKSRVLRRTEIPADAKEPTRDVVVEVGEICAEIIDRDIAELKASLKEA